MEQGTQSQVILWSSVQLGLFLYFCLGKTWAFCSGVHASGAYTVTGVGDEAVRGQDLCVEPGFDVSKT